MWLALFFITMFVLLSLGIGTIVYALGYNQGYNEGYETGAEHQRLGWRKID